MRMWGRAPVVLVWLCIACGGSLPEPPRKAALGLPIQALELSRNGLRVVLLHDPRASQIQVAMRYRVGKVDDPAGREGMAHLAEHLMFLPVIAPGRGTLFTELEATAPWFNAFTELETTTYVSRADPGRLVDLLWIEALRLQIRCRTLTEEEFVRERDVVRNELRQRADPYRTYTTLLAALYPEGHAYHRVAVVDEARVGRIPREEVCAFIDAHYSPDNAVLTVSGNVTPEALHAALRKVFVRIPKRPRAGHPTVAPLSPGPPVTRVVPISAPIAIVTWPLDADPALRARMRAVAAMMALHLQMERRSEVQVIELGDLGAPVIGLGIELVGDETAAKAVDAVKRTALDGDTWIRSEMFESARYRAGYHLFAQFEDGVESARLLADHQLAGHHPLDVLNDEIRALNGLSANAAHELMRDRFSLSKASVVALLPEPVRRSAPGPRAPKAEAGEVIAASIHRAGEPRTRSDPAAARAEAKRTIDRDPLAGIRERTLANGLRVILMPLASVPTVDARLVFPVGALDEPLLERGVAYAAAHALESARVDLPVARSVLQVGGFHTAQVGAEHTTFGVRGLAMSVDVLLFGLERLVRNGEYTARTYGEVLRRAAQRQPRDPLPAGWQAALHGPGHPYVYLERWNPAVFEKLDLAIVREFRSTHFRPDGATLIVSGSFDPAIVDRWIDHLFADWSGKSPRLRAIDRAQVRPVALAKHDERATQVAVRIALPVRGTRAARLIATRMIDAAVADVRTQLGASYGLHAELVEQRLATYIHIMGSVAAERAPEALALVRDRIGQLPAGGDAVASSFVDARRDVVARLSSVPAGASALADLAESALELEHPVAADLATAEDARKLTLDRMDVTLRALDLGRAAILLDGPRDPVTRAFAALGRTPRAVTR